MADTTDPNTDWLTPQEVADELGIAESTLRKWRMRNYGPKYSKWGGRVVYTRKMLLDFQTQVASVG